MTSLRGALEHLFKGPVGGVFLCLLIAGFLGGVAVAHPNHPPKNAATDESSDGPTGEGSPGGSASTKAPKHGEGSGDVSGGQPSNVHTPEDCQGIIPGVRDQLPAVQDATGLAHAIWVVEANCEQNPQAPGLVNALTHLVANWQRHQAHDAEKASSDQGNRGGHGNSHEHGNGGEQGNPGVHGDSSGIHGNSGVHGNSGDHGNSNQGSSGS